MTSTQLRRLLTATLFVSSIALGTAATATAEREWDIGAYDDCMSKTVRDPATCCLISGGNVGDNDPNVCTAPAAVQQGTPIRQLTPLRDLPTFTPDDPAPLPEQAAG